MVLCSPPNEIIQKNPKNGLSDTKYMNLNNIEASRIFSSVQKQRRYIVGVFTTRFEKMLIKIGIISPLDRG